MSHVFRWGRVRVRERYHGEGRDLVVDRIYRIIAFKGSPHVTLRPGWVWLKRKQRVIDMRASDVEPIDDRAAAVLCEAQLLRHASGIWTASPGKLEFSGPEGTFTFSPYDYDSDPEQDD